MNLDSARIVARHKMPAAAAAEAIAAGCEPFLYLLRVDYSRHLVAARRDVVTDDFVVFSRLVSSRRPPRPNPQRHLFE